MVFWKLECVSDSPLKFFFVKIQNQNEIEEFQTHPLFFRTQRKRDVLTNLSKRSPQKNLKKYCSRCKNLISKFYEKINCLQNIPLDWQLPVLTTLLKEFCNQPEIFMLNVRKRSEPFFDRNVFFSICSTGHLKRSFDKLAAGF